MKADPIDIIRERLSQEELLAQLAEECAELGKAALKLRRCYSGKNPTPVSKEDAYKNLLEELADVTLCVEVLGLNSVPNLYEVGRIWESKTQRWAQRLQERDSK